MREHIDIFKKGLDQLNIELTNNQIDQFIRYYEMLVETNKVMNLTAITEPVEVIYKHFLDSLSIINIYDLRNKDVKIIDIGTGAGFPGIPLKIAFPQVDIILLDSLGKRIKFLDNVVSELGLEKIECIHGRSEEYGKKIEFREKFDLCVSRAVANLAVLSEFCIPFVKVGGEFISYKAGNCSEEIENSSTAVDKLGGKVSKIVEFLLNDTDLSRTFVKISKMKKTPGKYPRKPGTPSKEPLVK